MFASTAWKLKEACQTFIDLNDSKNHRKHISNLQDLFLTLSVASFCKHKDWVESLSFQTNISLVSISVFSSFSASTRFLIYKRNSVVNPFNMKNWRKPNNIKQEIHQEFTFPPYINLIIKPFPFSSYSALRTFNSREDVCECLENET